MSKQEFLTTLVKLFFQHQINVKMFHFQTTKYGAHKASDQYLEKFNDTFDKFMEVAQGIFGKLDTKSLDIKVTTWDDTNIINNLDEFTKVLRSLDNTLKIYTELLNIRDEMLGDANQFRYLLTFN